MWSQCSCVIRIAESECGSSPSALMRLKVSRQEIPASTRIFVVALATIAQLPRLPEASMETLTPILASILAHPVDSGVTFWLSRYLRYTGRTTGSASDLSHELL